MSHAQIPRRLTSFHKMRKSNWLTRAFQLLSKEKLQPSQTQYDSIQHALNQGDPAMDQIIDWVMQDPKQHRAYFETALFQGLDQLPHVIPELNRFFAMVETPPAWLDQEKMQQAIKFIHRLGINSGFVLRDLSLMTGYLYPGFNYPLILTGALKKQAGKRMAETTKWWMDISEENAFSRLNAGFTSTVYVRFIHALVRHHLSQSKDWDATQWGCPINQFDLALTNIAFSGMLLIGIRGLAIFPNRQEIDSFLHFWKYVGWLMGIDEQWLVDQEKQGWRLLYWMQFAHPKADQSSIDLATSLSQEPFQRQYQYLRHWQQKIAYREHLDITQFFIGRKRMQKLGLPSRSVAWFAYYLIARNSIVYTAARHSSKVDDFLVEKGRALQKLAFGLSQHKVKQLASMHQE